MASEAQGEMWAVVDCETTGLSRNDRIVEIAVVTMDPETGEVLDEYDTLINPERNVGAVDIHGITASMVEAAPTFAEIAAALTLRLQGRVLVAHNRPFDMRMLQQEFERLDASFQPNNGICTYKSTRVPLPVACEQRGIEIAQTHAALSDARACAKLAMATPGEDARGRERCQIDGVKEPLNVRTHRRPAVTTDQPRNTKRKAALVQPGEHAANALIYQRLVNRVLDDGVVTAAEAVELDETAAQLRLEDGEVRQAHEDHMKALRDSIMRDGRVSDSEARLFALSAGALGVTGIELPTPRQEATEPTLTRGARVCLTGTFIIDGTLITREAAEAQLRAKGFVPVKSVTKRGTDAVIADDSATSSSKARKARQYGIPVLAAEDVLRGGVPTAPQQSRARQRNDNADTLERPSEQPASRSSATQHATHSIQDPEFVNALVASGALQGLMGESFATLAHRIITDLEALRPSDATQPQWERIRNRALALRTQAGQMYAMGRRMAPKATTKIDPNQVLAKDSERWLVTPTLTLGDIPRINAAPEEMALLIDACAQWADDCLKDLAVHDRELKVETQARDGHVMITFVHNAGGLAPEDGTAGFVPFARSKSPKAGLALPTVRYLARRLGGGASFGPTSIMQCTLHVRLPIRSEV